MMKPLVGISLDHRETGEYASYPWYALRKNYCDAVSQAGGVPLLIPYEINEISRYLDLVDGFLMPGGVADINPQLYGETTRHPTVVVDDTRGTFDAAIMKGVLDRGMPFLGICAGMQMLNVALSGTLHQHIPDAYPHALVHEQKTPKHCPSHAISIVPDTLLYRIALKAEALVNSTHHQAVKKIGQGLMVSAYSPDGVIEAIEKADHPFCLGVEWHPEYQGTDLDHSIFKHFIEACYGTHR